MINSQSKSPVHNSLFGKTWLKRAYPALQYDNKDYHKCVSLTTEKESPIKLPLHLRALLSPKGYSVI